MRWPIALVLLAAGCSDRPNAEQSKVIADIEHRVTMPRGGGEPRCWDRDYVMLDAESSKAIYGMPLPHGRFLYGLYRRSDKPGVHWLSSPKELPPPMPDHGCAELAVLIDLDIPGFPADAQCGLTWAGGVPPSVDPPVHC